MYKLRAYINGEMHDIKDYALDKEELTMVSTYKDTQHKLEDAEYVVIKTADLQVLLGEVYRNGIKEKTAQKETSAQVLESKAVQTNTKYNKTKK